MDLLASLFLALGCFILFLFALFLLARIYLFIGAPHIKEKSDGALLFRFRRAPTPLDFYLRVILSLGNFYKQPYLRNNQKIPRFEVICEDNPLSSQTFARYNNICRFGASDTKEELPITLSFSNVMALLGPVISHPKYPLKPLASLVHIKQTVEQLKPISRDVKLYKRLVFEGGENNEIGTQVDLIIEIYTSSGFTSNSLVAKGVTTFLIIKKRGAKKETKEEEFTDIPVSNTNTFKVAENTGLEYAKASGDYNPWHINSSLAKLFGFRRAIAQGWWSAARCLAEIGKENLPDYPQRLSVEWKKPLFLPSTVKYTERRLKDKNDGTVFELTTEDGKHVHLVGKIEHVPPSEMRLRSS